MSQVSWLGPLSFIVLIDDLMAGRTVYKYVDDTTLCEYLSCTQVSDIDSHIKCLLSWTTQNSVKINYSKTKNASGSTFKAQYPPSVERVCGFKLLGVYISNDVLESARLHNLKRLKRAGLPTDRLAIWCSSVIRPVLEFYAVAWHHGLRIKYQTEAIEAIQRRAIRIVYPVTTSMPYWVALQYAKLPSLSDWRDELCRDFFSANCLIHLIAFIICCHPLVTLKSHLGLGKQSYILDPVTVLTATNLSFITPF